jgi:DNA-binding beta-propeller fold protein YncE
MLNRKVSVAACAWLAAGAAALGQASGNAYLFQVLPATSGSDTAELVGYNAGTNNFSIPLVDTQLPAGTSRIIAKPDGSKFYFLVANSVQVADPGFVNFRQVNGITGAPASVAITPDGKYLLIGAGGPSGVLYIVDTNTDQVIGNVSPLSAAVVQQYGIAITQDSKRAFVLANNSFEQSTVTAVDLTTLHQIGANNLTLIGLGRGIALSPLNLLYVTAGNAVYEIDPATVSVTTGGQIGIVADPGPPRFTPDGTTLYCINHTPGIGGASIIQVNLANRFVAAWPLFNPQITPPLLDDVYIAGNGRIFAWSSQSKSLLDVNPVSLTAVASSLNSVVSAANVTGIAVSTELPSAHYLFLETTSGSRGFNQECSRSDRPVDGGQPSAVVCDRAAGQRSGHLHSVQ